MRKILLLILCSLSIFVAINISGETDVKAAVIGQVLGQPEAGWTRFDDTDPNISRTGTWFVDANGRGYNGAVIFTRDPSLVLTFNFYGTKLRIIAAKECNQSSNIGITIDGKTSSYSDYANYVQYQTLVYEVSGLSMGEHSVKIKPITAGHYQVDAIDTDGYLRPYREVANKEVLDIKPEKSELNVNQNVEADVSISKIDNITLEDMTITYDSSKLKYLGTEAIDGVRILKNKGSEGSLRIVCKGAKSKDAIKTSLLKLRFQAKAPGNAYIKVAKADVSNGKGMIKELSGDERGESFINIK